jgi:hypothetical protein
MGLLMAAARRGSVAAIRILLAEAKRTGDANPIRPKSTIDELARRREQPPRKPRT